MTLDQAVCCEKFVGWCTCNIAPMINKGAKVEEIAEQCIKENYPGNDSPVSIDFVKKYILASLS